MLSWQVINTVTVLVDQLSEEQFVDPPASPPSMASALGSTDSLSTDVLSPSVPIDAREAARNNIIREMVETERKYVQDLEIMQVRRLIPLNSTTSSHIFRRAEIFQCCSSEQHHLTRHNPFAFPGSQQTAQFPTEVSHPIGEHCRSTLERPALGAPFHRKCTLAIFLFRVRTRAKSGPSIVIVFVFLFGLGTIGGGVRGLPTVLCQLHKCSGHHDSPRAESIGTFLCPAFRYLRRFRACG